MTRGRGECSLLDASVIVAFLDRDDALHSPAVEAIRERFGIVPLITSAVALAEVLTGVARGHHDSRPVLEFREELLAAVDPVDEAVAVEASRIRGEGSLRLPDALTIAVGALRGKGCELLTADRAWRSADPSPARITVLG